MIKVQIEGRAKLCLKIREDESKGSRQSFLPSSRLPILWGRSLYRGVSKTSNIHCLCSALPCSPGRFSLICRPYCCTRLVNWSKTRPSWQKKRGNLVRYYVNYALDKPERSEKNHSESVPPKIGRPNSEWFVLSGRGEHALCGKSVRCSAHGAETRHTPEKQMGKGADALQFRSGRSTRGHPRPYKGCRRRRARRRPASGRAPRGRPPQPSRRP